jgi:hypothetical protein
MALVTIHSTYAPQFNEYLIEKIKADLKQSAFFFNPVFIFHNRGYTLSQCIDSLYYHKNKIQFKLYIPIKHLIYDNRQLYWLTIMNQYSESLDREYLLWKAKVQHPKTMSVRVL